MIEIADIMAFYKERLAVTTEDLIVARAQIADLQRQLQEVNAQEKPEEPEK